MNIKEIKERVSLDYYYDATARVDIRYLLSTIEQAEKALKFYGDWQTHHKLSSGARETPYDVDRGKLAVRTLQAIRGEKQ